MSTAPTETVQPTPADPAPAPTNDGDKLGEPGLKALQAERDARAAEERRANELQAKLDQIDRDKLSDIEKAKQEAQDKATEADNLRLENAKLRAIAKHSIPEDYQDLVHGTDADSFLASAAKVAALAAKAAGVPDPTPKPDPIPDSGTGNKDKDKSGGSTAAGRDLYNSKHSKK